jgi:phenylacetate-coenzyme A ligase PaaK-like adenylate-forming protein
LRISKLGRPPLAWFYPMQPLSAKLRLGSRWLALVSKMAGVPLPVPVFLDLQKPEQMAQWLSDHSRKDRKICLTCYASSAVRIATVAAEKGVSLSGVCFYAFGEPVTEMKREIIESAGARVVVHYGFTEGGFLGFSCSNPQAADDVHFFRDAYALIQQSRAIGDSGVVVQAFLLTSLLASAPKIMLNMDLGDHGALSQRRCGCPFEAYGLDQHIAQIRSYEKLSGEGMTFVKTDILRILEEVLPQRFGGRVMDYQLVEQEDEQGILRLHLIVSPEVGAVDETALRRVFLDELAGKGGYAPLGVGIWRRAETLRIKRQAPVATRAGKILPFHLIKG